MAKTYDFDVNVTSRHEDCSPRYKEEIIAKILKLSKYFSNIIESNVILDKQNSHFRVEITVQVPKAVISAKHKDHDRTKAFDATYDKVKTQIKKLKSKIVDHRVSPDNQPVMIEEIEEDEKLL